MLIVSVSPAGIPVTDVLSTKLLSGVVDASAQVFEAPKPNAAIAQKNDIAKNFFMKFKKLPNLFSVLFSINNSPLKIF